MQQITRAYEKGCEWLVNTDVFDNPETLASCLRAAAPANEYKIEGDNEDNIFATDAALDAAVEEADRRAEFAEKLAQVA